MFGEESSESLLRNWGSTFNDEKLEIIRDLVKDDFTKEEVNKFPGLEGWSVIRYSQIYLFDEI